MLFIQLLAILPVDSQPSAAAIPIQFISPDVDWGTLLVKIIFYIILAIISALLMRLALYGFRWYVSGTDEEMKQWSRTNFVQSAQSIGVLLLLLVSASLVLGYFGIMV